MVFGRERSGKGGSPPKAPEPTRRSPPPRQAAIEALTAYWGPSGKTRDTATLTSDLLALKLSSDDREFLIDNLPVVENPSSPVAASVARAAQCIRMLKYA